MSPKNQKAYAFIKRCQATGQYPDDEIVRHLAGIVKQVEDTYANRSQRLTTALLTVAIAGRR